MPLATPGPVAAHFDDGTPCTVLVIRLSTKPPRNAFSIDGRPVFLLSPDHVEDARRMVRADTPGAFGGFA